MAAGGRLLNAADILGHFGRHGVDKPLDFVRLPFGHEQHSPIREILHVTCYGETPGNVPSCVPKTDPLDPPGKQDLARDNRFASATGSPWNS